VLVRLRFEELDLFFYQECVVRSEGTLEGNVTPCEHDAACSAPLETLHAREKRLYEFTWYPKRLGESRLSVCGTSTSQRRLRDGRLFRPMPPKPSNRRPTPWVPP
jgi:hypothetical protein